MSVRLAKEYQERASDLAYLVIIVEPYITSCKVANLSFALSGASVKFEL